MKYFCYRFRFDYSSSSLEKKSKVSLYEFYIRFLKGTSQVCHLQVYPRPILTQLKEKEKESETHIVEPVFEYPKFK